MGTAAGRDACTACRPTPPLAESWRIEQTPQQLPGPLASSSSRAAAGDDAASVRTGGSAASSGGSTAKLTAVAQSRGSCTRCGYLTSRGGDDDDGGGGGGGGGCGGAPGAVVGRSSRGDERLCQACTLLEGLRGGIPRVGLVSERQARRLRAGDAAPA